MKRRHKEARKTAGLALAVLFTLITAASAQSAARGEVIQGKVVAVDSATNSLTVERMDADTRENVRLILPASAELDGVDSLEDIEIGDQIRVEATAGSGGWEIQALHSLEAPAPSMGTGNDANVDRSSSPVTSQNNQPGFSALPGQTAPKFTGSVESEVDTAEAAANERAAEAAQKADRATAKF